MTIKTAKGMFPSVKGGRQIYYKTHMQHHYLLLLEFDQSAVEIEHEPLQERIVPGSSLHKFRPDFLVLRKCSAELVFLVSGAEVEQDAFSQTRLALIDFCATHLLDFTLVTDKQLYSDSLVANLKLLHQFSRYGNTFDLAFQREILAFLGSVSETSIEELALAVRPHCPAAALIPIYNLIWHQLIAVPIREEPITNQTLVSLPTLRSNVYYEQAFQRR